MSSGSGGTLDDGSGLFGRELERDLEDLRARPLKRFCSFFFVPEPFDTFEVFPSELSFGGLMVVDVRAVVVDDIGLDGIRDAGFVPDAATAAAAAGMSLSFLLRLSLRTPTPLRGAAAFVLSLSTSSGGLCGDFDLVRKLLRWNLERREDCMSLMWYSAEESLKALESCDAKTRGGR